MKMKKQISFALALLMSVTLLATGCKKTNEDTDGLNDTVATAAPITQMTTAAPETTPAATAPEATTKTEAETTESETEATEDTSSETTSETETTTETSVSTEETTTTAAAETTAKREWSETDINEVMYTSQACYSRKVPVVGAETVAQYKKGTKVTVVAATDTGYYKLDDGSFIHADYLTDVKPSAATTTAASDPDIIEDPDSGSGSGGTSGGSSGGTSGGAISSSYNKDYKTKYGYKSLNADQQTLYKNIVEAAANFKTRVSVPSSLMSDDICKVYGMVFNQEPQLFWLSRSIPFGYGSIDLEFVYTKEEAAAIQKEIDKNVKSIMSSASKYTGSNVSKIKVFYDWIILNNTFSKSESADTCGIRNGLTAGGELQCAGYAKSILYLCDVAGIDCMTIVGTNRNGLSHAWNKVYCDNGWYNIDATWGDLLLSYSKPDYIRYNYFLVPDEWIKDSHINVNLYVRSNGSVIKYFDPPACTKTSCNYFKAYNKEYSTLDEAYEALKNEIAAAAKAKKNVAHIRVTDKDLWDTLTSKDYAKKLSPYAKSLGASSITYAQTDDADGILVVQYDLKY